MRRDGAATPLKEVTSDDKRIQTPWSMNGATHSKVATKTHRRATPYEVISTSNDFSTLDLLQVFRGVLLLQIQSTGGPFQSVK